MILGLFFLLDFYFYSVCGYIKYVKNVLICLLVGSSFDSWICCSRFGLLSQITGLFDAFSYNLFFDDLFNCFIWDQFSG